MRSICYIEENPTSFTKIVLFFWSKI